MPLLLLSSLSLVSPLPGITFIAIITCGSVFYISLVFSTFSSCSKMPVMFYHRLIHGLFFIFVVYQFSCFILTLSILIWEMIWHNCFYCDYVIFNKMCFTCCSNFKAEMFLFPYRLKLEVINQQFTTLCLISGYHQTSGYRNKASTQAICCIWELHTYFSSMYSLM